MAIDTARIISLLGEQVRFTPTRTDNVHTAYKQGDRYAILEPSQAALKINNSSLYSNAKIPASSAPKGFTWIVLDYDDKKRRNRVPDLSTPFGLEPTYTVKTPTGAGKQEWYLISDNEAAKLPKSKYSIEKFKSVEIFIGHKDSRQLFVAPGSVKDDIEYTLSRAIKPVLISKSFLDILLIQADAERSQVLQDVEMHAHHKKSEIDSTQNKRAYIEYLNKITEPFLLGDKGPLYDGDGRDNFIYEHACRGFNFNLSKGVVREFLQSKINLNSSVIGDAFDEDYIDLKVDAAYRTVSEGERLYQNANFTGIEPFESDEYGKFLITREELERKVSYLANYSLNKIMSSEELRSLLAETIIHDRRTGLYYVSRIIPEDYYQQQYQSSVIDDKVKNQIEIEHILDIKADTVLHWEIFSQKQMNEIFRYSKNNTSKPYIFSSEFMRNSFSCFIFHTNNNNYIIEKDYFFHYVEAPISPYPSDEIEPEDIKQVKELINNLLRYIVNPDNFEEEKKWLLDRYGALFQNPDAKLDNVLVLQGNQGSGKTVFTSIMALMLPRDKTSKIADKNALSNRFTEFKFVTHIDEVDLNLDTDTLNIIKSISTTSRVSVEKKFVDRIDRTGTVNLSVSTNDEIKNAEVLKGRRWTIMVNDELFSRDDVNVVIADIFNRLKANNWRLFRILHTLMLRRDTSKFKSDYKTPKQLHMIMESNKGSDISIGIANLIANYGYINNAQMFVPKELMNRHDIYLLIMRYYLQIDKDPNFLPDLSQIQPEKNKRISSHLDRETRAMWAQHLTDPSKMKVSKLNKSVQRTFCNEIPDIRAWIEILTVSLLGNRNEDSVSHIVDQFGFQDQWEWDNRTKPEIENLGRISAYDNIEFTLDEEDY
ncbi:MAG: DUF5906 domain-containing protein [Nitrosopumilus sp.]